MLLGRGLGGANDTNSRSEEALEMASHPTTQEINPLKESNIAVQIQWLHSQALCLYGQRHGKDRAASSDEATGKLEWITELTSK